MSDSFLSPSTSSSIPASKGIARDFLGTGAGNTDLRRMTKVPMLDKIHECPTMVSEMPRQTSNQGAVPSPPNDLQDVGTRRFHAVMEAAAQSGLLGEKSKRIGGRISPALLDRAKKLTGIMTDTELIEFALANVALDDDFGSTFRKNRRTIDPDLKLGF